MKHKNFLIFIYIILNFCICKKQEVIFDEDPFYSDLKGGCYTNKRERIENENCVTKKEELFCYDILQNARSSNVEKIFKNTKWTSENFNESDINYYINNQGTITVLAGGPSRTRNEYVKIGMGRIFKENKSWIYEQSCNQLNCDKLKFAIEFFDCSVRYYSDANEHRLFLTIGDRNYGGPENKNFLSIVLEDPVKPQIRNGFELYLVPPPAK